MEIPELSEEQRKMIANPQVGDTWAEITRGSLWDDEVFYIHMHLVKKVTKTTIVLEAALKPGDLTRLSVQRYSSSIVWKPVDITLQEWIRKVRKYQKIVRKIQDHLNAFQNLPVKAFLDNDGTELETLLSNTLREAKALISAADLSVKLDA